MPPTVTRSRRRRRARAGRAARSSSRRRRRTAARTGGGIDDYHCFLLDPKLTQDAFVTGALIRPQRTGIVHHVILYEAAGAQATAADAAERGERRQGLVVLRRARPAGRPRCGRCGRPARAAAVDRSVGARPHDERAAAGTGVLLHKGAKIVMQVHYNLIAGSGPDRSRAQLRLRPASTHAEPARDAAVAAPVELPCPTGVDRPAVQPRSRRSRTGRRSTAPRPRSCRPRCSTCAGRRSRTTRRTSEPARRSRLRATAQFSAPQTIYGVAGHMHLRGQRHQGRARPRDGEGADAAAHPRVGLPLAGRLLLEDAGQGRAATRFASPAPFDNSKADQPVVGSKQLAPRYVVWGEGTTDEMCLAMLSVAPRLSAEFCAHALVDHARVGLAAGLLHHLADEEAEQALLARCGTARPGRGWR